uniref:CCZ1 homolog, vacuolar protein trafficking and biogenesis associated n=1 Tax=Hucho hucho TaxID=62062 RepID=A0A4W5KYG6_9TELE
MSAAVCFMISASVELTREFCEQLDGLVGPQLTLLASDICEQYNVNRRISGYAFMPRNPLDNWTNELNDLDKLMMVLRCSTAQR